MLRYVLERAKEPSSYAGIAAMLTSAGIGYSTEIFNAAVAAAVAIAGLLAVLVPESKKP
jgi:hypothetical protein